MATTDPNFIVTTLPDYVQENRDLLIKDVVFGAPTIGRITPQTGIKTSAKINFLGADPVLQNGEGCGFTPQNTLELTQRTIDTALIKVNESICPDTLLGKWAEYLVRIPEPQRAELPFEAYVIRVIRDAIREKIEKLIWLGDTTSQDPDLKWINGFVTLAAADNDTVKVSIATGTPIWDAIKAVIAALPNEVVRRGNVRLFIAPELFLAFTLELVEKNLFHYNPGNAAPEEIYFPGTNFAVTSAAGLSGTGYIFASNVDNLYYGTDVEGANEQFKVVYDEKDELFFVKVRWNSGVQYAFPDRVVLGTIA
jgi:hypothetical protein